MHTLAPSSRRGDGYLWMTALGLSMLINLAVLIAVGLAALESAELRKKAVAAAPAPKESVATIFPELAPAKPAPETAPPPEKQFTRTSPDQAAPPDKAAAFIGERNTRATSDRTPNPFAPPLPSQAGIDPKDREMETTVSDYQDGEIANDPATASQTSPSPVPPVPDTPTPAPTEPAPPREATVKNPETPGPDEIRSVPPVREKLLEGPNPVDMQVPREALTKDEEIKPTPEKRPAAQAPPPKPAELAKPADSPKPKPSQDPAFKGYQRKTAIMGSISRTGRSSLDVEDSPLGRYQAAISRAVEQEWQRNCMRHRDFITPGFLTVRFFVETNGKVRSVQFVGDMETGEVQKGFTLNSIRNAAIPAMPPALRKEFDKEPLELVFRFYF